MELRDEIVESQKATCDLLKWKLGLVAVLSMTGLGLGDYAKTPEEQTALNGHINYILCLIPLVCIYVDMLSRHMKLRIKVIGHYKKCAGRIKRTSNESESESDYEKFVAEACPENKPSPYDLEDWALQYSTFMLSILVIGYGWLGKKFLSFQPHDMWPFIIFGLLGFLLSLWIEYQFENRLTALKNLEESVVKRGSFTSKE